MTTRTDAVFTYVHDADADPESERWGELIEWLCDPEGMYSFRGVRDVDATLMEHILAATEEEMAEMRLSAEICPVHHVDAAICLDDGIGDGLEHCGE